MVRTLLVNQPRIQRNRHSHFVLYLDAIHNAADEDNPSLEIVFNDSPSSMETEVGEISRAETKYNSIAFELYDETTPVKLKVTDLFGLAEIERQSFDIQDDAHQKGSADWRDCRD